MRKPAYCLLMALALPLGGCAGVSPQRLLTTGLATGAGGAAGAAAGGALSGGNPIGIAAGGAVGAVGGYAGGEIAGSMWEGEVKKQKELGRIEGEAQASKDFYRTLQAMQEGNSKEAYGQLTDYELTLPGGVNDDGIRLVPDTVTVPLVQ